MITESQLLPRTQLEYMQEQVSKMLEYSKSENINERLCRVFELAVLPALEEERDQIKSMYNTLYDFFEKIELLRGELKKDLLLESPPIPIRGDFDEKDLAVFNRLFLMASTHPEFNFSNEEKAKLYFIHSTISDIIGYYMKDHGRSTGFKWKKKVQEYSEQVLRIMHKDDWQLKTTRDYMDIKTKEQVNG